MIFTSGGGGVVGVTGGVHGKGEGLGADVLDLSAGEASIIFPEWKVAPIGVMA